MTTVLLTIGWLVGDTFAYIVGKYAGHPFLKQFIHEHKLQSLERYFAERMTFLKALIIRLALPAEIGYGFGLIRYDFLKYSTVTLIAEVVFAIGTVQASEAFIALKPLMFTVWLLFLAIIISLFYYLFRKKVVRKK